MTYASIASDVLAGKIDWSQHFTHRLTIVTITTLSYLLLGMHDWSSAVPALLCSVAITGLIWWRLRAMHWLWLAACYCLTYGSVWMLFYTDKLMSDVFVAVGILVAWLSYESDGSPRRQAMGIVGGLLWALLSKGTVVLVLPVVLVALVADLARGRRQQLWRQTIIYGTGCLLVYLAVYYIATGNALFRLEAIAANSYDNACNYANQPWAATWQRIGPDFWRLMTTEGWILPLSLALASVSTDRWTIYNTTIIAGLLSANLMTISWSGYNPMCIDPRHYLYLSPVLALSSVLLYLNSTDSRRLLRDAGYTLIALTVIDLGLHGSGSLHLLGTAILLVIAARLRQGIVSTLVLMLAMFCVLGQQPHRLILNRQMHYSAVRSDIMTLITEPDIDHVATTDVLARLIEYYQRIEDADNLTVSALTDTHCDSSAYIVESWYSQYHTRGGQEAIEGSIQACGFLRSDSLSAPYTTLSLYR